MRHRYTQAAAVVVTAVILLACFLFAVLQN
ncbi:hypothetical protein C8E99_1489 [Citricoccus muralis]|uniref:Uncharacterized protein n=1 Tax=Citricoccus muralis TaxID=169134 RepID=A0A3D9LBP3_9MICC|nr:hypothetical protein C8E99_1489 [Citricoccus muralis]